MFSEPVSFPGHAWWHSNLSWICSCFYISWSLMSVFQKWKRRKWKGKRGSSPINSLEITLARGVGTCNNRKSRNNGHFFVYTSVIRNGFERSEHRSLIFGEQGPFCTLVSASWPRSTRTAACYMTGDGNAPLLLH